MKKTSLNKMVFLTCLDYRTRVLFTKEETVTNCKEKMEALLSFLFLNLRCLFAIIVLDAIFI